jgi:hypothetical protein
MERLERLPFAARLAPSWRFNAEEAAPGGEDYAEGLGLCAAAMDEGVASAVRCAALAAAHERLAAARARAATPARLSTAARVAWALGHRTACAEALAPLVRASFAGEVQGLGEPFLPASARFDSLAPAALEPWFAASVLEQFERARAFSSFYTGDSVIAIADRIAALGYPSDEMRARRAVAAARAAARTGEARA